jgi:hypothetical protein
MSAIVLDRKAAVSFDHVCRYPGQINTILFVEFPHHILKCKIRPISACKLLNNTPFNWLLRERNIKYAAIN